MTNFDPTDFERKVGRLKLIRAEATSMWPSWWAENNQAFFYDTCAPFMHHRFVPKDPLELSILRSLYGRRDDE